MTKINALVIFPFESAALTKPVAQVKAKGTYVTVVDRGLTDTSAQDAYVAGDNTALPASTQAEVTPICTGEPTLTPESDKERFVCP